MELYYIVYITINLCNGKFYIGVHRTNPDIFDGYIGNGIYNLSTANKNYPLHKAVRKYGYNNFRRTTLAKFPNTEEGKNQAYNLEAMLVNKTSLKSKNIYNLALGGCGGITIEELKKPIYMFDLNGQFIREFECVREAAKFIDPYNEETTLKAIRNNCLGTSSSSFGYFWSYEKKFTYKESNALVKVAQYTLGGMFLKYYDSISEAERDLGISTIDQAIRKHGSCGGFQWRYFTGDTSNIGKLINLKTKNNSLPIIMLDKSNNIIEEFDSVKKCIEKFPNLSSSQINRVLSGVIKSHKGFVFKYKDEDIVLGN